MLMCYTNSKSRRYLRWLGFGSSTYGVVRLRRLNPRRLDFILDLKLELHQKEPGRNIPGLFKADRGEGLLFALFQVDQNLFGNGL